ncbi:hypothetical protein ACIRYZ_27540 [Kitasatospora sp. NPDC101155]|uniref:hypothetical protein n=1 Tax=Kitasatospora sp. NPDC101155 TaxID=3364097 RepID=UPI0037F8364E
MWGFRFPRDYTEFIARYGQGEIDRSLAVFAPDELLPPDAPTPGMHGMTEEARRLFEEDGEPTEEVRSAEQIIAWGGSCTADTLGWLTAGDDPDAWPVLVLGRNGGAPLLFDMGMVEFLHGVVSGGISPSPHRRRRHAGRATAPLRPLAGRVAADWALRPRPA